MRRWQRSTYRALHTSAPMPRSLTTRPIPARPWRRTRACGRSSTNRPDSGVAPLVPGNVAPHFRSPAARKFASDQSPFALYTQANVICPALVLNYVIPRPFSERGKLPWGKVVGFPILLYPSLHGKWVKNLSATSPSWLAAADASGDHRGCRGELLYRYTVSCQG